MASVSLQNSVGAYQPVIVSTVAPYQFTLGPSLSGTGAPTANPGVPFATYTDTATGNEYFWNGTVWTAIAGGGGGSVQIITGSAANPNIAGVIPADPTKAALYYQNGGGTLFQWDVPGQNWV